MFDERSPAMLRALAPYENSMASFSAELENRGTEFRAKLAKAATDAAERDRQLREILSTMEQQPETEQPQQLPPPDEVMEFGSDDEAQRPQSHERPQSPPSLPTEPAVLPQAPPARTAEPTWAPDEGVLDLDPVEESPAPQAPTAYPVPSTARPRRAHRGDDEEDYSTQDWLDG